jgi:importin-4
MPARSPILTDLVCPADTEKVKAATSELQNNWYSQAESLLLLIELAVTNPNVDIRQLSCVQALRIAPKFWEKFPQDRRDNVRHQLLANTLLEQNANTRHSKARLVAGITNLDLEKNGKQWAQGALTEFFNLANNKDNTLYREVAAYIFYSMMEMDPTLFADHLHELLAFFGQTIHDSGSKDVQVSTVKSIGSLLMLIEPEEDEGAVQAIHNLVPSMVHILKDAIANGEEQHYQEVFEVFQSFLAYDSALLANHLKDLIQFMIDVSANSEIEDDARSQALAFLSQCARYRRMKLQAMKDMGAQLMLKSMTILTEIDDDGDDDDMSPARTAMSLIDQLASDLPPRQVIVPLLDEFPKFARHEDPGYRKAAILALGVATEGAPDFISTQLKPILPLVLQLLNDANESVRHAALVGLIHLADELADELAPQHEAFITALLKNLEAATSTTTKKSVSIIRAVCGALDSLGDGLAPEVMSTYGPKLIIPMGKLLSYEDFGVKAAAAGAIGAIAASMGEGFATYFKDVMEALGQYVTVKDNEDAMALRSSVCDAMGRIATAVGPEMFQPYVMELMKASEEALGLDNARLKETSFILWSSLSKVYGEQFAHFLPGVFKSLLESLTLEEQEIAIDGLTAEQAAEEIMVIGGKKIRLKKPEEGEDATAMGDEDDEWDDIDDFTGVTAVALEQEIAIEILGDVIAHACGMENLQQYLESTVEAVLPFVDHSYEGCRKSALSTLWRAYARAWELIMDGQGVKWEPGFPPKQTPDASLVKLGQIVAKKTLEIWADDSDR